MSEQNVSNPNEKSGLPATSVPDLLRELFAFVSDRSRIEIGKAHERGRHQLEVRQLRKDRSKRLEKLGREVVALVEAGELVHPGVTSRIGHIKDLDTRIHALLSDQETSTVGGEE
jgi:hypothetical protein